MFVFHHVQILEEIAAVNLAKYRKAQTDLGKLILYLNLVVKTNIFFLLLQKIQLNVLMLLKIN